MEHALCYGAAGRGQYSSGRRLAAAAAAGDRLGPANVLGAAKGTSCTTKDLQEFSLQQRSGRFGAQKLRLRADSQTSEVPHLVVPNIRGNAHFKTLLRGAHCVCNAFDMFVLPFMREATCQMSKFQQVHGQVHGPVKVVYHRLFPMDFEKQVAAFHYQRLENVRLDVCPAVSRWQVVKDSTGSRETLHLWHQRLRCIRAVLQHAARERVDTEALRGPLKSPFVMPFVNSDSTSLCRQPFPDGKGRTSIQSWISSEVNLLRASLGKNSFTSIWKTPCTT